MVRKRRTRHSGKRKQKTPARKKARRRVKPQGRGLGDRVTRAYRTVVDTIKGTDRLRNKLEPPATSETE
jgi:hypothetical protein